MPMINIFIKHSMILAIVICFASTTKAVEPRLPDFEAKVTKINDAGVVFFDGNGSHRLWGIIVTDIPYLRELLVGRKLRCNSSGELEGWSGGMYARSRVVTCTPDFISTDLPYDIPKHLIEASKAKEFCAETLNLLGTCGVDALTK